jgi:hypothetical protein
MELPPVMALFIILIVGILLTFLEPLIPRLWTYGMIMIAMSVIGVVWMVIHRIFFM